MKTTKSFCLKIIFLIIIALTTSNCVKKDKHIFAINGIVKNAANNTLIYLQEENIVLDSTYIKDEQFSFSGIANEPRELDLLVSKPFDYASIWIEKGTTSFVGEIGDLKNAHIEGSKIQEESALLRKRVSSYWKTRDSLTTLVRNKSIPDSLKIAAKKALKKIYANHLKIETDFIKEYPNSYVSVKTTDFYATTMGKQKTKELYGLLSEEVKQSSYGIAIKKYLTLNKECKLGDRYVDFAINNADDKLVKLSDHEGKVILLDFWASWCGPCIKEYPALRKAYRKYKDKGFEIVSVSEDVKKESWKTAIEKEQLNWINLWSEEGRKTDAHLIYGINGIPDNFLIDKKGIIMCSKRNYSACYIYCGLPS